MILRNAVYCCTSADRFQWERWGVRGGHGSMRPTFETHVVSVGSLFEGDHAYRIPIFQRSYSWSDNQAAQLLDDLLMSSIIEVIGAEKAH